MQKIALFFGGKSCENEISVLTGVFTLNLLDKAKYEVYPVYIHTDGEMYTSSKMSDLAVFRRGDYASFKRVFFDAGSMYAFNRGKTRVKFLGKIAAALNCCHGGLGEGGGVSALMQLCNIPLASPDLAASGVFMDKTLTKLIAKALNIPVVEYIRVNECDYARRGAFLLKNIRSRLRYPVVVKPARLGSSIGVALAQNEEEAARAAEAAFCLDSRILIEKYVDDKRDVNCAAYSLDGKIYVSEPEEAASGGGIYSFADKYMKEKEERHSVFFAAKGGDRVAYMSEDMREKIRAYTRTLYRRMNLCGIVRMDYLVSGDKIYLGEVNTVPGSLAYYLFCERVSDASALFSSLIDEAIVRAEREKKEPLTTGILQNVRFVGKRGSGVRL